MSEIVEVKEDQTEKELVTTKSDQIKNLIEKYEEKLSLALPRHVTKSSFLRILHTEIARNPKLLQCSQMSLIDALLSCAQLGLMPGSITGEAWLIPYYNSRNKGYECQFQVGYKGLIELVARTGQLITIDAHGVKELDFFYYEFGSNQHLKFIPASNERGETIKFYAIAKLKSGGEQIAVMSKNEMDVHRSYSKAGGSYSPWVTHYEAMACKTMIKEVLKFIPKSTENLTLFKAIALDDAVELNGTTTFENGTPTN